MSSSAPASVPDSESRILSDFRKRVRDVDGPPIANFDELARIAREAQDPEKSALLRRQYGKQLLQIAAGFHDRINALLSPASAHPPRRSAFVLLERVRSRDMHVRRLTPTEQVELADQIYRFCAEPHAPEFDALLRELGLDQDQVALMIEGKLYSGNGSPVHVDEAHTAATVAAAESGAPGSHEELTAVNAPPPVKSMFDETTEALLAELEKGTKQFHTLSADDLDLFYAQVHGRCRNGEDDRALNETIAACGVPRAVFRDYRNPGDRARLLKKRGQKKEKGERMPQRPDGDPDEEDMDASEIASLRILDNPIGRAALAVAYIGADCFTKEPEKARAELSRIFGVPPELLSADAADIGAHVTMPSQVEHGRRTFHPAFRQAIAILRSFVPGGRSKSSAALLQAFNIGLPNANAWGKMDDPVPPAHYDLTTLTGFIGQREEIPNAESPTDVAQVQQLVTENAGLRTQNKALTTSVHGLEEQIATLRAQVGQFTARPVEAAPSSPVVQVQQLTEDKVLRIVLEVSLEQKKPS